MPVALVTGASRGIGAACATRLAAQGWDLGLTFAQDQVACQETAHAVRALGRRAITTRLEARESASITAAVQEVEAQLGPLDALIVNAGITRDGLAMRMNGEDWRAPIDINLGGTAATIRAAAAGMLERGIGSIVAITSIVGDHGNAGQANYAASKAGIMGLVATLAKEFGPQGVRINALAPGFIRTRLTDVLDEDHVNALRARTALGRLGEPDDIAGPVSFLVSPAAQFVTGTLLCVDGGLAL
jgi:3-oxoacyl-[acyl-carrier protein] reductase